MLRLKLQQLSRLSLRYEFWKVADATDSDGVYHHPRGFSKKILWLRFMFYIMKRLWIEWRRFYPVARVSSFLVKLKQSQQG